MLLNTNTEIPDIACAECGAKVGERCSDVGVFIRDAAFHQGNDVGPLDVAPKGERAS